MPFTFKLSKRLALSHGLPLAAVAALSQACEMYARSTGPGSPSPVVQLVTTPKNLTLEVSHSAQFVAHGRTAAGDSAAVAVVWSASGGVITDAGLFTAGGTAGEYRVRAVDTGGALRDSSTVTVVSAPQPPPPPPPPPPGSPGTVQDLAAVGVTDSSVTLAFTEVSDGADQPASYDIRVATLPISWGTAASVARGSCASPLDGTTVGARRTCTVLGLSPGTEHGFQLIAFRGTLNVDAVFGDLSNVATATTVSSTAPVASVEVSPASASVLVGATQQFSAVLRDANGNLLSGRAVSWSTTAPTLATVSATGLVTGLAVGSLTVTATSEGQRGTATLTVSLLPPPPPPPGGWPNQPTGFTTIADWGFDALTGSGWGINNGAGLATIVGLADAPFSGSTVGQWRYPTGFGGGSAPATLYRGLPGPREIYVGFWWKASRPWQAHPSNVNKLSFLMTNVAQNLVLDMYGSGEPYQLIATTEFGIEPSRHLLPNVTNVPVTLGQWHRVELYVKHSTTETSRDGIVRWWLDGVLVGDHRTVNFMSAPWAEFQFSPTWGGVDGTKTQTDYFWYDHVVLSVK